MQPLRLAQLIPALFLAACGSAAADASADTRAARDSAASVTTDSARVVATATGDLGATPGAASPAAPAAASGAVDTAAMVRQLIGGRRAHDTTSFRSAIRAGLKAEATWPRGPAAAPGAILPGKRIIAYYGNPLSKRMGVLGEYEPQEMLARLDKEVARWRAADPSTPVQPALHLVATVAQGAPGRDGKYRLRMDSALIEKVYGWARSRNAILFVDIQVGHSTVEEELKPLMRFLQRPDVHLGLDPEFSMHHDKAGVKPGAKIGTMRAQDINHAVRTLSKLVEEKGLPPKVIVVHRFTRKMVPDAEAIRLDPRVQIVMDMDGWGPPWLKFDSYRDYVVKYPVQYTGFKLFYHNDTKKGDPLLTPRELLQLRPVPLYIQYQ